MNTLISNPQFCSDQLQSAVDSAKEVFEILEETRNCVSNDIKKLEAYLQGQCLKESFRFGLGKSLCVPEGLQGKEIEFALSESGSASGDVTEEAIVWGPHNGDRYRLHYELSKWDGGIEALAGLGLYWDEATLTCESKPLIEAKFEVRKRMYLKLPDFIDALRDHLRVEPRPELDPNDPNWIPF